MNAGKLTLAQRKRSVWKNLHPKKSASHVVAEPGCGYTVVPMDAQTTCVTAMGSCSYGTANPEVYAFAKAWNKILTGGTVPQYMKVQMLLPARGPESRIREMIQGLADLAGKRKIDYIGGHTELLADLRSPIVTVILYGAEDRNKQLLRPNRCKPGMGIYQIGYLATEATAMLWRDYPERVAPYYAKSYQERITCAGQNLYLPEELATLNRQQVVYMRELSTGGIFAGLYEFSDACGYGISASQEDMPILQETIEVCERFDISPYLAASNGSAILVAEEDWEPEPIPGVPICRIGQITDNNGRIVLHQEEVRYLNPMRGDELYRIYHANAEKTSQKEML